MDLNIKKFLYFNAESEHDKFQSLETLIHNYDIETILNVLSDGVLNSSPMTNTLLILARCCCNRNIDSVVRNKFYSLATYLCKTSEELFLFVSMYNKIHKKLYNANGWTNYIKTFIRNWYNKSIEQLMYDITTCNKKYTWEHKDLIRLAHVKPTNQDYNIIFKYILRGKDVLRNVEWDSSLKYLIAYECMKHETNEFHVIEYIKQFKFNYKQIPPYFLTYKIVWEELLREMAITDILDNINKLHDANVFNDAINLSLIKNKMETSNDISPLKYLYTYKNYVNHTLYTNVVITQELMLQFYKSFNNLTGLNSKICVGLNITNNYSIMSSNVYIHELSCALSMIFDFVENDCSIIGFKDDLLLPLNITAASCLEENMDNLDLKSSSNCDELFKRNDEVIVLITDSNVNMDICNETSKYIIIDVNNKMHKNECKNVLVLKQIDENIYNNIVKFCTVF